MMKVLRKKRKGGFTLIELIVVIAILGILALIAVPRFAGFRDDAVASADEALVQTVKSAVVAALASGDIIGTGTITTTEGATAADRATFASTGVTFSGANTVTSVMQNLLGADQLAVQTGTRTHVVITITNNEVTATATN